MSQKEFALDLAIVIICTKVFPVFTSFSHLTSKQHKTFVNNNFLLRM